MKVITPILFLLLLASQVQASPGDRFQVIGGGCWPTDFAMRNSLWETAFSPDPEMGWETLPEQSGTLQFQCYIPIDLSINPSTLAMYFQNTTTCSVCGSDSITMTYYKINKTTGAKTFIASVNSSGGGGSATTTFTDTYSPTTYVYYVSVAMVRGSSESPWNNQLTYLLEVY